MKCGAALPRSKAGYYYFQIGAGGHTWDSIHVIASQGAACAPPAGGTSDASTGAGGAVGADGAVASGGASGTTRTDAGLPDGGNCISKIINNGYACGTVMCSACKSDNTSLEAKCKAVLDCIESKYPCSGNCSTECFNSAGATGPVQACVSALQTAACGAGGGC